MFVTATRGFRSSQDSASVQYGYEIYNIIVICTFVLYTCCMDTDGISSSNTFVIVCCYRPSCGRSYQSLSIRLRTPVVRTRYILPIEDTQNLHLLVVKQIGQQFRRNKEVLSSVLAT